MSITLGLGLGLGLGGRTGGAAVFDPATLTLPGWWRADYASIPHAGTASAGTSGAKSLTNVGDADPVTGNQVNGLDPMNFVAASGHSTSYDAAISNLIAAGDGAIVALAYVPSAAASAGAFASPAIVSDGSNVTMSFTNSGLEVGLYDGAQRLPAAVACSTGAWHALFMKWDGVNVYGGVDGGAYSSTAAGNVAAVTGTLFIAKQPGIAFLNLRLLDLMFMNVATLDANRSNLISYFNARYGLAL